MVAHQALPASVTMTTTAPTAITLSEREQREYNLTTAILDAAAGRRSGLAFEISDELATRAPDNHGGLFVPYSIGVRSGLDTATSGKGAELKFVKPVTFIEALMNAARVMKAGATVLDNLSADVAIPKQTGTAGATWAGQNPGVDVGDTNATFSSVGLTPHVLIGTTSYSKQLLAQATVSPGVDSLVRRDLARVHAVAIDAAALTGSGGNQPTGLFNRGDLAPQTIAFGANGLQPTWPLMTSFEKKVSVGNGDVDEPTCAYITTPEIRDRLRITDRSGGTSGWYILLDNAINEYPVLATNQVPKTLTKGTSAGVCHGIAFGDWSELLIGLWGGFEIVPDPYKLKKQGMIEVTTYQLADTNVRHIAGFAVSLDALP